MQTDFLTKCKILGTLWVDYSEDERYSEFLRFHDLGLPLAYAKSEGMVVITKKGKQYIDQTWEALLAGEGLEDTGFESLSDIIEEEE